MQERQLATIRKIAEVQPIPNADAIEAVRVGGWWVVAKKGEFPVDSLAVYCEIDSFIPTAIAPFLTKAGYEPKEFEGVKGECLRTIRLRGFTSQGLLLPLELTQAQGYAINRQDGAIRTVVEGDDVTGFLGILKYEKPLPAALAGMAKGNFPSFIPKTDQPRIQNCTRQFQDWISDREQFEITEKIDGSSMTAYVNHKEFDEEGHPKTGVCSRNLDLKRDEANSFWESAIKENLIWKIASTGRSLAIQGELAGEGIQGNSYKIIGRRFFCFDIWDIDKQEYLLPEERIALCEQLGILHVPIVERYVKIKPSDTVAGLLSYAEGKSVVGCNPEREGLVWKSETKKDVSVKIINNKWLLKGGE